MLLWLRKHLTKFENPSLRFFLKEFGGNSCHYTLHQLFFWSLYIFQSLCTRFICITWEDPWKVMPSLLISSMLENSFLALIAPVTIKGCFLLFSVEFFHQVRLCLPLRLFLNACCLFNSFIFSSLFVTCFFPSLFLLYTVRVSGKELGKVI